MSSESLHFVEQTDFSIRFARGVNEDGALVIDQIVEVSLADAASLAQHVTAGRPLTCALRPKNQRLTLADAGLAKKHAGFPGIAAWAKSSPSDTAWLAAVQSVTGQNPADAPWLVSTTTADEFQQAVSALEGLNAKPTRCVSATIATAGALAAVAETPVLFLELGETLSHGMVISRDGVLASAEVAVTVDRIAEAVQSELNLKFRGSALKLFLNPDYDFSDVAANIATKFAAVLQPAVAPLLAQSATPSTIFVGGLPAKQQWFVQPLAAALNLPVRVTDVRSWCERNGVKFTRELSTVALSPAWFGFFHFIRASALGGTSEPWQAEWITVDAAAKGTASKPAAAPAPAPAKATPAVPVPTPMSAAATATAPAQPAVKLAPRAVPAAPAQVVAAASSSASPVATAAPAATPKTTAPTPTAKPTTGPSPAAKPTPSSVSYSAKPASTASAKNAPASVPPTKQPPSQPGPKSVSPEPATPKLPPNPAPEAARRKSKAPLLIALGVLVVAVFGGFIYFQSRSEAAALALQKQQTEARIKAEQEKARLAEQKAQEETEARRKMETELAAKLSAAEEARQKAEAEAQAQVQARLASARGSLVITTDPAGALVTVGALPARRSPITFHDLKIGHYTVVISLPRYEEKRLDFEIQENVTNEPPVIALVRMAGNVELASQPAGAQYEIHPANVMMVAPEDRHTGTTPASVNDLPPGDYEVTISRDGWAPHMETISVTKNQTSRVNWIFPNGVAKIDSTPSGAAVLHDGTKLGVTPLTLTDLPAGAVHYDVALDNFDPVTVSGRIENGATLALSAEFHPEDRYYSVNELDHKPDASNAKQPELPYYLTLENGKVEVQLVVARDGSMRDVKVLSSTNKDLNKFCLTALAKWQFKPGTKNGAPMNTRMTVPFVFKGVKS